MLRRAAIRWCPNVAAAAPLSGATATPAPSQGRLATLSAAFRSANAERVSAIYGTNFTVSRRCWDRIHQKNAQEHVSNDNCFLRLAVESGGCHGYMYKFQFDTEVDEDEDVLFTEDVCDAEQWKQREGRGVLPAAIVVDKSTSECMTNAVLDYHTELKGSAFVVVGNEKVDHLCACAMSFSVKK